MSNSEIGTDSLAPAPPQTGSDTQLFERFLKRVAQGAGDQPPTLKAWRDLAESWRITHALHTCAGNRSAAARQLGIGRRTLYAKMEKLGIDCG